MLRPQDISQKTFDTKLRGYNIDQVNDFMDRITHDYNILNKDDKHLRKVLHQANIKGRHYDKMKKSLNQSILVAQEAADKVRNKAKNEVSDYKSDAKIKINKELKDAKQQANDIMHHAIKQANTLSKNTMNLQHGTNKFRNHIKNLLRKQLKSLDNDDWKKTINNGKSQVKKERINADRDVTSNK